MTQPNQLPLAAVAQPAQTPDGTWLVQLRILIGPAAFILELPTDTAQQVGDQIHTQITAAVTAVRRVNLGAPAGLILPGTPVPPNGHHSQ